MMLAEIHWLPIGITAGIVLGYFGVMGLYWAIKRRRGRGP
jgi:hypothetical protein